MNNVPYWSISVTIPGRIEEGKKIRSKSVPLCVFKDMHPELKLKHKCANPDFKGSDKVLATLKEHGFRGEVSPGPCVHDKNTSFNRKEDPEHAV